MALALVGAPSRLSYEAYKALKAAGGALGAALAASEAAALGAMAAQTAAALGAGVGGFLIGQAILRGLEQPDILPEMGEYFEAGNPQQLVRLTYDYFVDGNQIFSNAVSQLIVAPVKGMFFRLIGGASTWFVFDGNGVQQNIVSSTNTPSGTRFELKGFVNGQNQPVAPTKRLPSFLPKSPDRPLPAVPTPLTIPGVPPFPITPVVVPNPGNDEPNENEERPPGVIVQIPQTGTQIRYEPGGVTISNYNAPNKEPFRVPPLILPPGGIAATPPCCESDAPEPEPGKDDEIICRIKTLQESLLDDGFEFQFGETPIGQSGKIMPQGGELYRVQINVLTRPQNLKIQASTPPAKDVWYVGWYAFLRDGIEGARYPIHFDVTVPPPEPGVNGMVFQLVAGCTGKATWNRRSPKAFVDRCVV